MFSISGQTEKLFYKSPKGRQTQQFFHKMEKSMGFFQSIDNNPVRKDVKFPIVLLRLLGVLPVQDSPSGVSEAKLLTPIMAYSAVMVGVMIVGTLFMMDERYWRMMDDNSSFGDKVLEAECIIFFLPVTLVPVTHWFEARKKAKFVNSWRKFETEYLSVTGKPLLLELTATMRKVKIVVTLSVVVITTLLFVMERGFSWWQGLPLAYSVCLSSITTGAWGSLGKALEGIAQKLIEEIQASGRDRRINCSDTVRQYKALWLRLSALTEEFGRALGISYGCNVILFFVQQVLAIYGLLSEMNHGLDIINGCFLFCALIFSYAIFVICDVAQKASEQVGDVFRSHLQELESKLPSTCNETRYEIALFLQAIASSSPKIKFCGCVEVNRGLLASLMSAMVTYLVVLMQFQMSSKESCPEVCTSSSTLPTSSN